MHKLSMRPLLLGGFLLLGPALASAQTTQVAPSPEAAQQPATEQPSAQPPAAQQPSTQQPSTQQPATAQKPAEPSVWELVKSAKALAAGDGVAKDPAKARELFEKVMASDNAAAVGVAALALANLADSDLKDPALAARALERGIEVGDPWCMVTRAQALGKEGPQEQKRAVELNLRAMDLAKKPEVDKVAYYNLGQLYLEPGMLSSKKALDYHQRAADLGNLWSLIALGSAYEKGVPGTKPNWAKAKEAYAKAYASDQPAVKGAGAFGLAMLYSQPGHSSSKRAVAYLQDGQKYGNSWATLNLADHYMKGLGVKRSSATGRKIYLELRNSPDPAVARAAALPLGKLYASSKPRNLKLAEENLVFAASNGDVWPTFFLAQFYIDDMPSKANRKKATHLLKKLAASDDPAARRAAKQMLKTIH